MGQVKRSQGDVSGFSGEPFFRFRRGFTLVELLVVITIIGLLAAILTTAFQGMMGRSKKTATKALVRKLENGLELYENDFQRVPRSNMPLTVKTANEWTTIDYPASLEGHSAQLHALVGARLRHVTSRDPATGNRTFGEAGPYMNIKARFIQGREKNNYRKPIIDAWKRIIRVRYEGMDHSERPECGTRNNENWVDIWSEGPRMEKENKNPDGCGKDDINNFGKLE